MYVEFLSPAQFTLTARYVHPADGHVFEICRQVVVRPFVLLTPNITYTIRNTVFYVMAPEQTTPKEPVLPMDPPEGNKYKDVVVTVENFQRVATYEWIVNGEIAKYPLYDFANNTMTIEHCSPGDSFRVTCRASYNGEVSEWSNSVTANIFNLSGPKVVLPPVISVDKTKDVI